MSINHIYSDNTITFEECFNEFDFIYHNEIDLYRTLCNVFTLYYYTENILSTIKYVNMDIRCQIKVANNI